MLSIPRLPGKPSSTIKKFSNAPRPVCPTANSLALDDCVTHSATCGGECRRRRRGKRRRVVPHLK